MVLALSKTRIGAQLGTAEGAQDRVDVAVRLQPGEEEPPSVAGAVGVHERRLVGVAWLGAGHFAQRGLEAQVPPEHVGAGPQQRCLHHASTPGRTLLEHAGENPRQRREPAHVVADAAACVQRYAVAVGQLDRKTGTGPEGTDVVGGAVAVLAAQPVAAHAAVDEARMPRHRLGRLEPEPVERVRAQVGDEDVGRLEQFLEQAALGLVLQVEHHAALAPVVQRERGVRDVGADAERSEGVAHGVAVRLLHLDHVRAPVGQEGRRRGRGHPHAELHYPQVGQGGQTRHAVIAHAVELSARAVAACSRSTSLTTLPVAFVGSSSTISTARGTL